MVVTASLAHGVVRAAALESARSFDLAMEKVGSTGLQAPATLRRFAEWFRKQNSLHEKHALLFVYGMVGRRLGRFAIYFPNFREVGRDWVLGIDVLTVDITPGNIQSVNSVTLPVVITGHALERMFQRTDTVQWSVIRDCLAGATLMINSVAVAYVDSGCRQCAIPAEKGLLVGQLNEDVLHLRTFLPDSDLNPKWQSIYQELKSFSMMHKEAIECVALTREQSVKPAFELLLRSGRHGWLYRDYVPGEDPLEDAWRSRQEWHT